MSRRATIRQYREDAEGDQPGKTMTVRRRKLWLRCWGAIVRGICHRWIGLGSVRLRTGNRSVRVKCGRERCHRDSDSENETAEDGRIAAALLTPEMIDLFRNALRSVHRQTYLKREKPEEFLSIPAEAWLRVP